MNTRGSFTLAVFLGALFAFSSLAVAADEELLRLWRTGGIPVWDRAEAVNRSFTNGTPIRTIVAVLGTNFYVSRPVATVPVWEGELRSKPRKTCSLSYLFGDGQVTINTSAAIGGEPLAGEFTGAGVCIRDKPYTKLSRALEGWEAYQIQVTCRIKYYQSKKDHSLVPASQAVRDPDFIASGGVLEIVEPLCLSGQVSSYQIEPFSTLPNFYYSPGVLYEQRLSRQAVGRLTFPDEPKELSYTNSPPQAPNKHLQPTRR